MSWYLWHDSWSWFLSSSGTQENGISHLSKGCDKNNNFLIRSSGRQMFICLSLVCLFHFCIPGTCLVFPCLRLMKKGCRPWIFDFSSFLFLLRYHCFKSMSRPHSSSLFETRFFLNPSQKPLLLSRIHERSFTPSLESISIEGTRTQGNGFVFLLKVLHERTWLVWTPRGRRNHVENPC